MAHIYDHNTARYRMKWENACENKYNGAFYYSKEIVSNIIPRVKTDRSWVTVNVQGLAESHAIVFVHNNLHPERYEWLRTYGFNDLILVCGVPETCDKIAHLGRAIYLPLSIDTKYVLKFKAEKKNDRAAYVGRRNKAKLGRLPAGVDFLSGMPRQRLLPRMAEYKTVYAVGRTAIEAKALGCEVKAYDPRFPDPDFWKVVDNREAAKMLQRAINEIDGKERVNGRSAKV